MYENKFKEVRDKRVARIVKELLSLDSETLIIPINKYYWKYDETIVNVYDLTRAVHIIKRRKKKVPMILKPLLDVEVND